MSVPDPLSNLGDGWRNTECRTHVFASEDDDDALLVPVGSKQPLTAPDAHPIPILA
jgi:hypothetical protein